MKRIFARLREPSTWAGLAMLAAAFGVPAMQVEAVTQIAVAVCGAVSVFMPESAGK